MVSIATCGQFPAFHTDDNNGTSRPVEACPCNPRCEHVASMFECGHLRNDEWYGAHLDIHCPARPGKPSIVFWDLAADKVRHPTLPPNTHC